MVNFGVFAPIRYTVAKLETKRFKTLSVLLKLTMLLVYVLLIMCAGLVVRTLLENVLDSFLHRILGMETGLHTRVNACRSEIRHEHGKFNRILPNKTNTLETHLHTLAISI